MMLDRNKFQAAMDAVRDAFEAGGEEEEQCRAAIIAYLSAPKKPTLLDLNPHRVERNIKRYEPDEFPLDEDGIRSAVELLIFNSHGVSIATGWHHDVNSGDAIEHNVGERLMLMVSEISESMEGHRKGLMDDKLPHRIAVEVELADAMHRICDFAGKHGLDLGGAMAEKGLFNLTRPDHRAEVRRLAGGKSY